MDLLKHGDLCPGSSEFPENQRDIPTEANDEDSPVYAIPGHKQLPEDSHLLDKLKRKGYLLLRDLKETD